MPILNDYKFLYERYFNVLMPILDDYKFLYVYMLSI